MTTNLQVTWLWWPAKAGNSPPTCNLQLVTCNLQPAYSIPKYAFITSGLLSSSLPVPLRMMLPVSRT